MKRRPSGLTIVIPAYNRQEFIGRCLDSTLNIGQRPLQVILVDDGSDDGTIREATNRKKQFEEQDIELLIQSQEHAGAQVARNFGLDAAKHDLVMFLDSDDYVDAVGLDKLLEHSSGINFEMAIGVVENVNDSGDVIASFGRKWEPQNKNRILDYDWHTCGVVYHRDFLHRIGGWAPELCGSQDWEIQVRAKSNAKHILFQDIRIGYWVAHHGRRVGATTFKRNYTESVLIACGLNLKTLQKQKKATIINQFRLAARVSIHLAELRDNGFERTEVWPRIATHYPPRAFWFSLAMKVPWQLIKRIRSGA